MGQNSSADWDYNHYTTCIYTNRYSPKWTGRRNTENQTATEKLRNEAATKHYRFVFQTFEVRHLNFFLYKSNFNCILATTCIILGLFEPFYTIFLRAFL